MEGDNFDQWWNRLSGGEPTHTPPPWKLSEGDTWISVSPMDENQPLIADMIGFQPDGPDQPAPRSREECRANAVMMAAAPDLLDACECAAEILEGDDHRAAQRIREKLLAAIAKAKGQTN